MRKTSSTRSQMSARSSTGKPASKSSVTSRVSISGKNLPPAESPAPKSFQLPAFSIPYEPKVTESELDKIKKRTIRRNAPPGEDLKAIKTILRDTKDGSVTVQEFISLVAPSTGDRGEALRQVMNDDLVSFRKLARKVYDTVTQDNSDVLLNQQMQLAEYYREKKNLLNNKMMRMIEEIFEMVPKFDFDRYEEEKEKYLEEVLPIPEDVKIEPEEMEMMKRQAAYHRLQWLRSEGERLNEENRALKKRLNQMRKMHMDEQRRMVEIEQMAEAKKEALEEEEAEKEEILDTLNRSLEKTIIAHEKSIREAKDAKVLDPKTGAVKKVKSKAKVKRVRRPKWNEEAAAEIEQRTLEEAKAAEKRKVMKDPFHFSPIKTPSPKKAQPREVSPFHYSPPKSPVVEARMSPRMVEPSRPLMEMADPTPPYRGRKVQGPRDSWGGFY